MARESQELKDHWKRYTQGRREALRSVDVVYVTLPIPKGDKEKILSLLQPYTDRVRLLSILVGASPYDRPLVVGLLQSLQESLTLEEVEAILHFRSEGEGEAAVRAIVARRGLPGALAELPE